MKQDSIQILQQIRRRLARFAKLGERFFAAIDRGNAAAVYAIVAESRRLRQALAWASLDSRQLDLENTPENRQLLDEIRRLNVSVDLFDQGLNAWLDRDLPDDRELLTTELGAAALADKMLPLSWDYAQDLVVLVGGGLEMVAAALRGAGQERIIAYVPKEEDHEYPAEVPVARGNLDFSKRLRHMVIEPPKRLVVRTHPDCSFDDEGQQDITEFINIARRDLDSRRATIDRFGSQWIQQSLANLPDIASHPSIASLKDAFRGKPMIVVAPGPSLSKNIEALRAAKGKALIVTMTHALGALQKAGIEPDLTMVVDAQDLTHHFEGIEPRFIGALTSGPSGIPALFDLPVERNLTFAANSLLEDWVFRALGESAFVMCGGSVSTSAAGLATAWGCSPVIICGLDLSFPNQKRYAQGSFDNEKSIVVGEDGQFEILNGPIKGFRRPKVMLPGYDGGEVPTSIVFSLYHRWFEWYARQPVVKDAGFINATEGGARIKGFEQMPLETAIAKHCTEPVDFAALYDEARAGVDFVRRRTHMLEHVNYLRRTVRYCQRQARLCLLIAEKARQEEAHEFHYRARLERAEGRLQRLMARVGFVSLLRQRSLSRALKRARAARSFEENTNAVVMLLNEALEATEEVLPILERSAGRLEAALGTAKEASASDEKHVATSPAAA